MAVRVTTYDPAKVIVTVAGNIIAGYAPGQMVQYRPDVPVWADALGVDNEPVRWASGNPMATLTFFLSQASTSNFILSALLNLDRITSTQPAPVTITDSSGPGEPTIVIAQLGWVSEQPALLWGATPTARQWDIRLMRPVHVVQGLDQNPTISL